MFTLVGMICLEVEEDTKITLKAKKIRKFVGTKKWSHLQKWYTWRLNKTIKSHITSKKKENLQYLDIKHPKNGHTCRNDILEG